jgi:hypothetical protein
MNIWTSFSTWSNDTGVFGYRSTCATQRITETVTGTGEYLYTLSSMASSTVPPVDGSSTGALTQAQCPAGTFVIGVEGRQSCTTDQLRIRCAAINYVRNGTTWVAQHSTAQTLQGPTVGAGGSPFSQTCPTDSIVTHLQSRTVQSDAANASSPRMIQSVQLVCQRLSYTVQ